MSRVMAAFWRAMGFACPRCKGLRTDAAGMSYREGPIVLSCDDCGWRR